MADTDEHGTKRKAEGLPDDTRAHKASRTAPAASVADDDRKPPPATSLEQAEWVRVVTKEAIRQLGDNFEKAIQDTIKEAEEDGEHAYLVEEGAALTFVGRFFKEGLISEAIVEMAAECVVCPSHWDD